ncbi:MAG: nucleotidyltransferase [Bdellovibrionota bacterium]
MESRIVPPDNASMRQTEMGDAFNRVLFSALDGLESRNIPYGMIGGIAASGHGRPRSTHDIDIFVRPEDADAALEALAQQGFETEVTDPRWLYKGWKEEMMVDVIFKSQGDIYFDDEMHQHAKKIPYHGRQISAVSPEDLMIIKAAVHSEVGPHHWHDALAILSHAQVDWKYLLKRARKAPRRILALLIYAQSNDILIPNNVIVELMQLIYGDSLAAHGARAHAASAQHNMRDMAPSQSHSQVNVPAKRPPPATNAAYLKAHVLDALAKDPRTAALDVQLDVNTQGTQHVSVKGDAVSNEQRTAIEHVIRDHCKGFDIDNKVRVTKIEMDQAQEVV